MAAAQGVSTHTANRRYDRIHAMQTHSKKLRPKVIDLRALVEAEVALLASRFAAHAIRIELDVPSTLTVLADEELYRRAVRNLMLNAVAAMPYGGTLTATAAACRDGVELEIADSGLPLAEAALHRAFDAADEGAREAAEWSLASVRNIAELHGGDVTAMNCPDGGAAFTLRIPSRSCLEAAA
jgi:signal transduction histidine kinase